MRVGKAVFTALLAVSLIGLRAEAQSKPRPNNEKGAELRGRVLDAMSKGNATAAQKMLGAGEAASEPTAYEELRACGFYPQETRLACVIEIKQSLGYGNTVGSPGTFEYVSFYVDFAGDGFQPWDYTGSGIVHITDGSAGSNLAVYRDFNPNGGPRTTNSGATTTTMTSGPLLKARAILRWATPATDPNEIPFWGNVIDFQIRMLPIR
jgi:hypothetical protein